MDKNIKRGDIVWIDKDAVKEYDDTAKAGIQAGHRPYIVVSNNINNIFSENVNLIAITKQKTSKNTNKKEYDFHVPLKKEKYNLKYDSIALAEQLKTMPKDVITSTISSLDDADIEKLNSALALQILN